MAIRLTTALAALLFCTALSAETFAQAYLRPGYVSPVDRQLSHTSDGSGRPLPGWYSLQKPTRTQTVLTEERRQYFEELRRRKLREREEVLDTVRFSQIEFAKTPLRDAVIWLREEINARKDPAKTGLLIVLKLNGLEPDELPPVTLSLSDVTARQALEKVADSFGLKVISEEFALALYKK